MTAGYQPLFKRLPPSPPERFALITEYVKSWSGEDVAAAGDVSAAWLAAEERLGAELPQSLRLLHESGLHAWFVKHRGDMRIWPALDELALHERTDALTVMQLGRFGVMFAVPREALAEVDPPICEYRFLGQYSDPPFKMVPPEHEMRLSEMVVREALLMADELVPFRRPVYGEDGAEHPQNQALRCALSRAAVMGLRNDTFWYIYEGPDVIYVEGHPQDGSSFYALLSARSEAVLARYCALPD